MPAATITDDVRGLKKPKSKLRLRLGLTPPHPTAKPSPKAKPNVNAKAVVTVSPSPPVLPPLGQSVSTGGLTTSTSTTASTGLSRIDSRSAFTYDNYSPTADSVNGQIQVHSQSQSQSHSPPFETISLNTEAEISRSTLIDSALPPQTFYPTPSATGASDEEEVDDDALKHPHLRQMVAASDDIFYLTDRQLGERFCFDEEIGFGNWGSVWKVRPRHSRASQLGGGGGGGGEGKPGTRLGRVSAASGGSGAGGKVAIKLVHRERTAITAARVRALWGEMKIIRQLRAEPHPSIIQFEAFIITESFALVIMPYLSHLIPVCLSPERATPYFRQLCSAVGYLHERGITHNDIKPANVLLSYNDVPVLVDFGFANKWQTDAKSCFLNDISWGTPEYLDPHRAKGLPHDERMSDVWSLGITIYEILIGRTPFEENEEEDFQDPDQYLIYYERSVQGHWFGEWSMPDDLQHLIRSMVCPDPLRRITAMQAYHHPALQPAAPAVIITPHFVRAATNVEEEPLPPIPYNDVEPQVPKKKVRVKKDAVRPRSATPTALGESIKQHTSAGKPKRKAKGKGKEDVEPVEASPEKKGSKLVIKNHREHRYSETKVEEEDPTPTKITKPAQPLRVKEVASNAQPRTSTSENPTLSRPTSTQAPASARDSITSTSETKEEAMLKTMSSLEGKRLRKTASSRDVLGKITRPAPKPPVSGSAGEGRPASEVNEKRRSVVMDKVEESDERENAEVRSEAVVEQGANAPTIERVSVEATLSPARPAPSSKRESIASPPRQRRGIKPHDIVLAEEAEEQARKRSSEVHQDLPNPQFASAERSASPLAQLRQKILDSDQEEVVRFRKNSSDLMRPSMENLKDPEEPKRTEPEKVTGTPLIASLSRTKSVEALAMDTRLDKLSEWVKGVEHIIGEARKALAEGREPPLPLLTLPSELSNHPEVQEIQHQFGLTPKGKDAVPAHLRTSSTQVEPATPPKWMTYAEAEERVKLANQAWGDEGAPVFKKKKDRPTVSHVMKLFGQGEKEKPAAEVRSNTPEPSLTVPLKPPALRGVPSTPALRSSTTRNVPQRKSESNLRNSRQFNTMPTLHSSSPEPNAKHPYAHGAESKSPPASSHPFATKQSRVYEQLLETTPGVMRQGEGWSSRGGATGLAAPPPLTGRMGKTSSMLSLREKARAILGTGNSNTHSVIGLDYAPSSADVHGNGGAGYDRGSKRESKGKMVQWSSSTTTIPSHSPAHPAQRPGTPGAASTLSMSTTAAALQSGQQKKKGLFKAFKWGKKDE